MNSIPCLGCSVFFIPRNKLQQYCSKPRCQKARKALWQRSKKKIYPEYRENQKLSQQKWLRENPDYWKNYRQKNPAKTDRNRLLQKIRNRRIDKKANIEKPTLIAKMDARKFNNIGLEGEFWLIPVIAKMDAAKIIFHIITTSYEQLQR